MYKVKAGHDQPLEDLLPITPQPRTSGMLVTRRQYAASGIVIDEQPYVLFEWSMLDPASEYQNLLDQFGLTTATTAPVSIYVQDQNYEWVLRNATVVKPLIGTEGGRNNFFIRDIVIVAKNLQAQA